MPKCQEIGKISCIFRFLASETISSTTTGDKVIIFTVGESVLCSSNTYNLDGPQPCSHEEADTKILIHNKGALNSGHKQIMIRTVDTDVVVLAVASFCHLDNIHRAPVDCNWDGKGLQIHSCSPDCKGNWSKHGERSALLSCIHWIGYHVLLCKLWQEISLEYVTCVAGDNRLFHHTVIPISGLSTRGYN